jgi:RHH-type proline utilization regulon transcriptional repressor/proline dehydrogenase/delta 1-pyrroline-5-carboxylate dehydrogenase
MKNPLSTYLYTPEAEAVKDLLADLSWSGARSKRVEAAAAELVKAVRSSPRGFGQLEAFLQHYTLTSDEGLALMCLAEALLRIPDAATRDALIEDKMQAADWGGQEGSHAPLAVKAAGLGLMMTSKTLKSAIAGVGRPFIRNAMVRSMRQIGKQFVLGETIDDACAAARGFEKDGYRMSYDMLGEGARTQDDADHYFASYRRAIRNIGDRLHKADPSEHNVRQVPGISVKLSALHPRYEFAQEDRCVPEIAARLSVLAHEAAAYNIALTVDAEEVERLELSLEIIERVLKDETLRDWRGFGLAVQAYQKRAPMVIDHVYHLAQQNKQHMQVRLVKGAYWDREIKRAQVLGLEGYPVYTRKTHSDVSYLACAEKMFKLAAKKGNWIYPMFGTHNAHSVAAILEFADGKDIPFEFQKLYGMGDALYAALLEKRSNVAVSIYAPVGPQKDLLAYLVRRLLENGANSSFVNKLLDEDVPVENLVSDPVAAAVASGGKQHDKIKMPSEMYRAEKPLGRENSSGIDLDDPISVASLLQDIKRTKTSHYAAPLIGGKSYKETEPEDVVNPGRLHEVVGTVWNSHSAVIKKAMRVAHKGYGAWHKTSASERALILNRYADLLQQTAPELMGLLVREAGKTIEDAHLEVREAVDFCRYYANRGRQDFAADGYKMPGPTGEENLYKREGRGVFVCISPWNFPLAIFTGQIAAALMAGNAVVAKPAEQTPLIAYRAAQLWHKAGVPGDVLNLVIGDGEIGAALVGHKDVAGVAFTGSGAAARSINQTLAVRQGPIVPLIAETGGQNAMLVDSSALPEQVVDDVIRSAFGSAGQRCSALRILCVQEDIADGLLRMLKGAMQELRVGLPGDIKSDLGPVIDDEALQKLLQHKRNLGGFGKKICSINVPGNLPNDGYYFGPCLYEIDTVKALGEEVFGPILHVVRYRRNELDELIEDLNDMGYGLTLGVHSRIDSFVQHVAEKMRAGNVYVNRSMTGAVVGTQPFGGHGLSGTGPKAGGPDYLLRFATEKVISTDTTASGGNTSLVSMD